jgi:hypothetical protein
MTAALAQALAALAVSLLSWYAGREDIRETERGKMLLAAATLANRALAKKLELAARADGGARLRVRDDAGTIRLPGDDPDPQCPRADCPLRGARRA